MKQVGQWQRGWVSDGSEEIYSPHEVADFLEDNGFDVIITEDGSEGRTEYVHRVLFEGWGESMDDADVGRRAAELALQHGYPVFSVRKVWDYYRSNRPDYPYWQMDLAIRM